MGKVVDMFYFPLFQWNGVPRFLNFLVDSNNYFFGAIFNLADAYISVAVIYLLLFQYKFLSKKILFEKIVGDSEKSITFAHSNSRNAKVAE